MVPSVKEDVLKVLRQAVSYVSSNDILGLKRLSDNTIHNSLIYQDEDSISVAVALYSISKMMERKIDISDASKLLQHAERHLERDEFHKYKAILKRMFKIIASRDAKYKLYVQDVIDKAQIKKGSKLYHHGVSVAKAASLLGISQWELMNYIGKTELNEPSAYSGSQVSQRLDFAIKLFIK